MKGKAIIPLVLGLVVGLIAVKVGINTLKNARASGTNKTTVTVVQATQDIRAFQEIAPEMVQTLEVADNALVPTGARLTTVDEVVGRVAAKAIPEQAAVLQSMLSPPGTPAGLLGRIPPGFRAVSVRIDEVTGVAYQISPGDWVDVIVVMDVKNQDGRPGDTIAEVILQHVQVGAIGRSTSDGGRADTVSKAKPAKSATLLVAEKEVPKLHLAATRGKITLSMRGDDSYVSAENPVADSSAFLAEQRNEPEPIEPVAVAQVFVPESPEPRFEPEPILPHGVTVFHGGSQARIERITFKNNQSRQILELTEGPTSRMASMMLKGETYPTTKSRTPRSGQPTGGQTDDNEASNIDQKPEPEVNEEAG